MGELLKSTPVRTLENKQKPDSLANSESAGMHLEGFLVGGGGGQLLSGTGEELCPLLSALPVSGSWTQD